ncbi:MAG: hypothetical protein AAGJ10_15195 [Bacteroidota bacterium]
MKSFEVKRALNVAIMSALVVLAVGCETAASEQQVLPHAPYRMDIAQLPDGFQDGVADDPAEWIKFADPFGVFNTENGITDGEAAHISYDGQYIISTSKADGRYINRTPDGASPRGQYEWDFDTRPTIASARLRLWNAQTGELIWDQPRSREPDNDGDFRPDNQPSDLADEIEIALFSPDDQYVAAGAEDDQVEVWRIKDPATGALLDDPVLVKTFSTAAAVDGMVYSHSGDLLLAGTENAGEVEIYRVQGDPSTWQQMGVFKHGGAPGNAVNSLDITQDDAYVATHGTNREGIFWDLEVARDASGLITRVAMTPIATLGDTADFEGSGREARFSNDGGPAGSAETYLALTNERDFLTRVYAVDELKRYTGPQDDQVQVPQPVLQLRNGDNAPGSLPAHGTEIEPADFSPDGRFFVNDGDSRDPNGSPNGVIFPGFLRVYETAEWSRTPANQEPDPIWVERGLSTEFLAFSPDGTRLASAHGDGTLRVWDVTVTEAQTIAAEGFNESTATHDRWTLARESSAMQARTEWGTSSDVDQTDWAFVGERGTQYVAANNLGGEMHTLTLNEAWDIGGFDNRRLQFAAVAAPGVFEPGDFLRLLADLDADGSFETTIAEFLPDSDGDLAWNGQKLHNLFADDTGTPFYAFTDFFVDLEALLPSDFGGTLRFQLQANTDDSAKELGFDSLRVTGVP